MADHLVCERQCIGMELPVALGLFLASAVVVVAGGIGLAMSGDVIAIRTGWGRLWVGSLLVGGGTSLPELVTTITAVRIDTPALAAGAVLGANMLNITKLALVVAVLGGRLFFQRVMPQQSQVAIFAIAATGVATLLALIQPQVKFLGISPATVIIIGGFVVGSRIMYLRSKTTAAAEEITVERTLRWGWTVFAIASVAILVSAPLLAISAERIAEITGIAESFIGVLAVAFVTSLPELAAVVAAIRIGAPDLAVAEIYGSNTFNIVILGVADLFYTQGSLFGSLDMSHVTAGVFAILLMSACIVQLRLRRPVKHVSLTEPSTSLIVGLYLVGIVLVFVVG